jgi:dihydroxyacetone kinase-like protein
MSFTLSTLRNAVASARDRIQKNEAELNAADALLGDGDTGSMLARVMDRMAAVDLNRHTELGAAFGELARATLSATGSSLGTLFATALLTFSKAAAGQDTLTAKALAEMLENAVLAMIQRGGAALGDKTILDGLKSVATHLSGVQQEKNLSKTAAAGAWAALQAFHSLPCRVGRARLFPEKSCGAHDPGMLALWLLLQPAASGSQES